MVRGILNKAILGLSGVLLGVLSATPAYAGSIFDLFGITAQTNLSNIAQNITTSMQTLPGLLTAVSYLVALLLGVTGVLKLKEHVSNPTQVALRVPLIRFIIGGALLALPIVYESMTAAITGGGANNGVIDFQAGVFSLSNGYSSILGTISAGVGSLLGMGDINFVLSAIAKSLESVPGLITAVAYMLGLLFGVIGLLKIKGHVENPDQVPMKEGVIRLLVGGALFALPNVYEVMQNTVIGDYGSFNFSVGGIMRVLAEVSGLLSNAAQCNPIAAAGLGAGTNSLGDVMCNITMHAGAFPAFLTAIAYVFGLVLGFWGVLKVQEHVLNPEKTNIWEGISRFIAAGCFFALPAVLQIIKATVAPATLAGSANSLLSAVNNVMAIFNGFLGLFGFGGGGGGPSCNGLDGALQCFMMDISGPFTVVLSLFTTVAGSILIMIGISRLIKSAQEGARGPGGFGTMMTFLTGGMLLSYNEMIRAFGGSMFGGATMDHPTLAYTTGMTAQEVAHAESVVTAVVQFMVIIGLISFVRGLFIIRGVAEGNNQASIMAGVTHLVGGAMAVNLGPLLNAVQETLGISGYGIAFS